MHKSQSPQAGQFNSYWVCFRLSRRTFLRVSIPSSGSIQFLPTDIETAEEPIEPIVSIPSSGSIQFLLLSLRIHPLASGEVSIPSSGSIQFLHITRVSCVFGDFNFGLNPLKRVNSILTNRYIEYVVIEYI